MKRKLCFVCGACCYYCPNANCDLVEAIYDIPCSDVGLERIDCKDCYYNSGFCDDCLLFNSLDCPEVK